MNLGMSGVFTGMDTDALIAASLQMDAARIHRLANRKKDWQARINAVNEIERRFRDLRSLVNGLSDATRLRATSASASNRDVLSVTSGSGAIEGFHQIEVDRLAGSHKMVHAGLAETDSLTGTGRLVYTYNGQTREISTTAETTLSDLVALINNDAHNPGITATLLEHEVAPGQRFHLVLTGNSTGSANTITIEAGTTLAGFEAESFEVTQEAADARIRVNGYPRDEWISKSSNTISDVISGVTLHLHTAGTSTISLQRDTGKLREDLRNLVNIYNGIIEKIGEYVGFNEETQKGGVLQGDHTLNAVAGMIRSVLTTRAPGFDADAGALSLPADLGFSLDRTGTLELDTAKLDKALESNYLGVLALIGATGTGATNTNDFQFSGSLSSTRAGIYEVEAIFDAEGALSGARMRVKGEGDDAWREAGVDAATGQITGLSGPESGLLITVVRPEALQTVGFEVRVQQGFAGALHDRLEDILNSTTGTFKLKTTEYQAQIERINRDVQRQEDRLIQKERRLRAQYARLEATLAQMDQMRGMFDAVIQSVTANQQAMGSRKR